MPSYVFKLSSGAEMKLEKDGVDARVTELRILKTRSGFNNKRLKFMLTAKNGFSNAHTLFNFAKENKLLKGGGRAGFTIESYEKSFSQKSFYKLYMTDEEFKEAFDAEIAEILGAQVTERYADINDEIADPTSEDLDDEFDE